MRVTIDNCKVTFVPMRGWRRILQSWGSARLKRLIWNKEFAGGRWDHLAETPGDCVYRYVEKYAHNGDILDLGCGSGNTGSELDFSVYQSYTGVDISDVAIRKAVSRSELSGRILKNHYVQSDISTYAPEGNYCVILFRESLYYVPQINILKTLRRYQRYLDEQGVFVVRLDDRNKHKAIHELIRKNFHVLEEFLPDDISTALLVFR